MTKAADQYKCEISSGSCFIAAGSTATLSVTPQCGHIVQGLVVSSRVAESFVLHHFNVGVEPLIGGAGGRAMSLGMFVDEMAAVKTPPSLRAIRCEVGMDVSLTVENITNRSQDFWAQVIGCPEAPLCRGVQFYDRRNGREIGPWLLDGGGGAECRLRHVWSGEMMRVSASELYGPAFEDVFSADHGETCEEFLERFHVSQFHVRPFVCRGLGKERRSFGVVTATYLHSTHLKHELVKRSALAEYKPGEPLLTDREPFYLRSGPRERGDLRAAYVREKEEQLRWACENPPPGISESHWTRLVFQALPEGVRGIVWTTIAFEKAIEGFWEKHARGEPLPTLSRIKYGRGAP